MIAVAMSVIHITSVCRDSSSDVKFSRHLIFNLKNAIFQNNIEAGKLIAPTKRGFIECLYL